MKKEENAEQKLNLMIRWRPLDFFVVQNAKLKFIEKIQKLLYVCK
jgi:hypothetical protein